MWRRANDKISARYPGVVTLDSFTLKRGQAREREAEDARQGTEAPVPGAARQTPSGSGSDLRTGAATAAAGNGARLAYEIDELAPAFVAPNRSEPRLRYDIAALPGRARYHIARDRGPISPATPSAALSIYGIGKKPGANIGGLVPTMIPVMGEVAAAAEDLRLPRPVLTSGNDGHHKRRSLHYQNRALDFRGNNIRDFQGHALHKLLRMRLGDQYDVLFEQNENPQNDHIHVEYDPPKRRR